MARHLLVCADEQLLARLAACIKRATYLRAAETAVVQLAAVLAGKWNALGNHLVDDVDRNLRQAMHVGLARAEVASLDGVLEQAIDAVAVALVVLCGVDAALSSNGVCASWRVVKRKRVNLVTQLCKRCGSRCTSKAGANHDDLEFALVVWVYQLGICLVVVPLIGQCAFGNFCIKHVHCPYFTIPAMTAMGNETLPTTTTVAKPVAKARRQLLKRGLFQPID